jgi:23S rRNA (adenine2030-N6)-methyltransferase
MNYRHAFHAGNFADVLKHAVLARMLVHLRRKERPFRVIDTHAGRGVYDLSGEEACRTGEWRDGIGRLVGGPSVEARPLGSLLSDFLAPYLEAVAAFRAEHGHVSYPGSPAVARHFLRKEDHLLAVEAQAQEFAVLARLLSRGRRAKALNLDGFTAWEAFLPPKERRGLVIVDPPYEAPDEFARVASGLETALGKWPSGSTLIWYPVKDDALVGRFIDRLAELPLGENAWCVAFEVGARANSPEGLSACGLVLINPPWTLPGELKAALLPLAAILSRGPGAKGSCHRIAARP